MKLFFKNLSSDKIKVFENYFYLTIIQGLNYLLPFLVVPFLVRHLGISNFGLVSFAQALMVFFIIFTDFGFNTTATREIARLHSEGKDLSPLFFNVLWSRIALVIIGFLILLIITFSFDKFYKNQSLYLISYGVVVGQAIFPVWFFQGIEKMKFITVINVVAKVIFTVLIFIYVDNSNDFILVPVFNSTGFIIAGLLSLLISFKTVSWKRPDFKGSKIFYIESFQMFVSSLSTSLVTSLNVFLLGIFGGDFLVGIYSSFEKLILAAKNMFIPIYQALYPFMSRQSITGIHRYMKKILPGVVLLGFSIVAVFYFLSESILYFLYKEKVILEYTYLFKIMSIIALISGLHMMFNVLYAPATRQFKLLMWIMISAGVFNLILSLSIVPIYKIQGTVLSVVITELFLLVLCTIFYVRDVKKATLNT